MPFPFTLPTTSSLSFTAHYSSTTHPSLPLAASTHRSILGAALKHHKRLSPRSQPAHLAAVLAATTAYLPYLAALEAGLSGTATGPPSAKEAIDMALLTEPWPEWRAVLSASPVPGRPAGPRVRTRGLESEMAFVLSTAGLVYSLLARAQLHALHAGDGVAGPEQRTKAVGTAMKHLLAAHGVHAYLAARAGAGDAAVLDTSAAVQTALAELALAEATLIAVLKDDPYPAAVAEERSATSKAWMVGQTEMPKVRAHLFARLCLAAGEHAGRAVALLAAAAGAKRLDEALTRYLRHLRAAARAKACRFLGIDAELAGRTGEAIAWLRAAMLEMGVVESGREAKSGLSRFRMEWRERREDRRVEKGADWGGDAGTLEEARIVELLERKWVKLNDTLTLHPIPPAPSVLASMPSGREYHSPPPFALPTLDEDELARLRALPDAVALGDGEGEGEGDDDSGEEGVGGGVGGGTGTGAYY